MLRRDDQRAAIAQLIERARTGHSGALLVTVDRLDLLPGPQAAAWLRTPDVSAETSRAIA